MGIIEDIKRMQLEGKSEPEIQEALGMRGFPPQAIHDALSQARIKDAVTASESQPSMGEPGEDIVKARAKTLDSMQPSLLSDSQSPVPPEPSQEYASAQDYPPAPDYQNYPQQQYQQEYSYAQTSADSVTEIAEQVVAEKMHVLRSSIEKTLDLRNSLETRMAYLDERLKRIEKIIDRLQLSILQKVGDYMTNVEDIKKGLVETQKSFKSLLPEKHSEN